MVFTWNWVSEVGRDDWTHTEREPCPTQATLLCTKTLSFWGALEPVPSEHTQVHLCCGSSSMSVMLLHCTPELNCPFLLWASLL